MPTPTNHALPIRRSRRRQRLLAPIVAGLVLIGLTACEPLPPAPPGGTAADCSDITWGSGDKFAARMSTSPITNARAAGHRCYDRLVIDLGARRAPGWFVHYAPVTGPGTGDPVAVRGGASLEIIVRAPTYDVSGHGTYSPANPNEIVNVAGFQTFRQVVTTGSFEGQTTFGIGARARLPYRVFAIEDANGSRLVIDIAHRWS